jgi:hypothetical protein
MPSDPPASLPLLTGCSVCRHGLVATINRRLKSGESGERVSAWLKDLGPELYVSPPTLRKHRDNHLSDEHERARLDAADHLRKQSRTIKSKPGDLAVLVRDQVFARVEEGTLDPSLAEGLRAQEMIDRRAAQSADHDVMIAVAGLLSGAVVPVAIEKGAQALLPPGADEAEYRELADEKAGDEAEFARLLRDPDYVSNPYQRETDR